jgi:glucose-6-phosphate 1-dehydrogenase
MLASTAPTVLVVFGATGDLMERKIAPSVYNLFERGRLPERFRLVGFARRDLSPVFREMVSDSISRHHGRAIEEARLAQFLDKVEYARGQFDDEAAYRSLHDRLEEIDAEWGACSNKLFYLAVPPGNYASIVHGLKDSGLAKGCPELAADAGWTRVIVEKPFGHDAASAAALDGLLSGAFEERQIYRIDHYLAKEMLQGVMSFRFSNNLLERAWDNHAIERIEIDLLETIGVEGRGDFYDAVGALRDVGQNHLLQMLALIAMDRPASLDAHGIREARARALETLRPFDPGEVTARTFRAQYDGYREVEGVAGDSDTETFFEVVTELGS